MNPTEKELNDLFNSKLNLLSSNLSAPYLALALKLDSGTKLSVMKAVDTIATAIYGDVFENVNTSDVEDNDDKDSE